MADLVYPTLVYAHLLLFVLWLGADVGVGTTGVAGPDPHDGEPVGSVWIAVATSTGPVSRHLSLTGDRAAIRRQTVEACWDLVLDVVQSPATGGTPPEHGE